LFDSFELSEKFDLIIFAQPYFPGEPIEDYEFTKGMLNTQSIQNRFFENAKKFLNKNGKIQIGFLPETNQTKFWLIEWEVAGKKYSNHYLAYNPPVKFSEYVKWLPLLISIH